MSEPRRIVDVRKPVHLSSRRRVVSVLGSLTAAALLTAGLGLGENAWATESPEPDVAAASETATPSPSSETSASAPATTSVDTPAESSESAVPSSADGTEEASSPSGVPSQVDSSPPGTVSDIPAEPTTTASGTPAPAAGVTPMAQPYAGGTCNPDDLYFAGYGLWKYTAATGQFTQVKEQNSTRYIEALGVTSDGIIYIVDRDQAKIYRIDPATGIETTYTVGQPLGGGGFLAAAVNPQNGIFYYLGYTGTLYAFDTKTNTSVGFVGKLSPAPGGVSDIAFDSEGNLYAYWGRVISKVDAANVPTTAQATTRTLTATQLNSGVGTIHSSGLAWMSSKSSRQLWSVDYGSQSVTARTPGGSDATTVLTLPSSFGGSVYDMASCPSAASATAKLSLAKNVVGRATGTDQFTLRVEQPAGTVRASATTSGSAVGEQSQVAEVTEATRGATYTLREVGAGATNLSRYTSDLECRNSATNAVIGTSGSGGVHTLTYPAEGVSNIACTFTNVPPATLTVTTELPSGRFAASDQFTVELREGGATGAIVETPGNETTEGQGTTVTAGTGTTGAYEVTSQTQYTITERGEAGVELANYTSSITCTDATGLQTGLPNNVRFDPAVGRSLTLVPGAQVSCVITNSATGAGVGVGEGLTCQAGYIYGIASTYPYTSPGADGQGYVYKINTTTGQAVVALVTDAHLTYSEAKVRTAPYNGATNALAVSQGGLYSYFSSVRRAGDPANLPVFRQNNLTGETDLIATVAFPSGFSTSWSVRGGIDPTTGIYWISTTDGTTEPTARHHFWAYNTLTGQNYGYVGYLTTPQGGGQGDLVFDQDGNMLFVTSNQDTTGQLWRISFSPAALASRTSQTDINSLVTKELLTGLPRVSGQSYAGVSFDNDGYLYVLYSNEWIQKLDPNTGAAVGSAVHVTGLPFPGGYAGRRLTDLADCNDPGGLRLQKDYAHGRVSSTDNVKLEIGKGGIDTPLMGGFATTQGPATGLQKESAGVIIGVPGGTYVLTETPTTGTLSDYSTSLACVDKTHGDAAVPVRKVSQGRYEFDFPSVGADDGEMLANVVCTYVNTPNGTLELEKRLASDRADDADQFQVRIRTGGQNVETATTSGTGNTVTDGVTKTVRAQTGPNGVLTYAFDELGWRNGAELAAVLEEYPNPTLTCADAAGLQPEEDLPYEMPVEDFEGIAPVPGAQISCVITNNASKARMSLKCEAGYVYSIDDDGRLEEVYVDPTTGLATVTGHPGWSSVHGSFNGLGASSDGTMMYAYQIERVGGGTAGRDRIRVFSYDNGEFDPTPSEWFQPSDQGQYFYFITGAVNPVNRHYVFGGFTQDATIGLVHRVYDYNPGTGEFSRLGYFPTGDTGMKTTRTNSDIAFDAAGNLYVLQSLPDEYGVNDPTTPVRIHTVTAANLAAAGGGAIPATATEWFDIVKAASGGGSTAEAVVGLAFDADGAAYLSTKTVLYRFNPATWEQLGEPQAVLTSSADLASCNSPSTFTVKKDIVARLDSADQFTLFAGKGETVFATETTDGDRTGIQPRQVGPVPVYSGGTTTYSFGETIADGSESLLADYSSSWECTDSSDKLLASGTGAEGQVTFNPTGLAVTCVLTNAPHKPIGVEKLGLNCDVGQPVCDLPGAEFALYDVDPTTAGATPLQDGISADPGDLSRFISIGLAVPGEYWLVETKAPKGFTLLAAPIAFRLTADGIVLDDPDDTTVQLKDGDTFILQVTDATPAPLPKSGGDGPWPFLLVGLALFLGAGLAYHRSSRPRVRPMRVAS